jgi:TolA-binding protein
LDGLAEEAQSAASMGHISQVYKAINKFSCKPAHPRVPVKDKAGKVLTNMEEQLRRWIEHFEEIQHQPRNQQNTRMTTRPHR